jgi:hypothetical protein
MGGRVGCSQMNIVTAAGQLGCNGGGNGRLADPAFAHRQDDTASAFLEIIDELQERWELKLHLRRFHA